MIDARMEEVAIDVLANATGEAFEEIMLYKTIALYLDADFDIFLRKLLFPRSRTPANN